MNIGHACQLRHVQHPCKVCISQTLHTSSAQPCQKIPSKHLPQSLLHLQGIAHQVCLLRLVLVLAGGYQKLASSRGVSQPRPHPPWTRSWRRSWEALVKMDSIQHKTSPSKAARNPVSKAQLLVYLKKTGVDQAQQSST